MSEEKITGVCVDIPTVIAEAKARKRPFEWQYKTAAITFDASNLTDAERFLIENECQVLEKPVPTVAKVENTFTDQFYNNLYGITESAEVKEMFAGAHTEKPDGWISVAERLPENEQECVLHCVDKNYSKIGGVGIFLDHTLLVGQYFKGFGFLVHGPGDWFGPVEVIEWLPIPASSKR